MDRLFDKCVERVVVSRLPTSDLPKCLIDHVENLSLDDAVQMGDKELIASFLGPEERVEFYVGEPHAFKLIFYRPIRNEFKLFPIVDMFLPTLTNDTQSVLIDNRNTAIAQYIKSTMPKHCPPAQNPRLLSCRCLVEDACLSGDVDLVKSKMHRFASANLAFANACKSGSIALVQYLETVFTSELPMTRMLACTQSLSLFKYLLEKNVPFDKDAVFVNIMFNVDGEYVKAVANLLKIEFGLAELMDSCEKQGVPLLKHLIDRFGNCNLTSSLIAKARAAQYGKRKRVPTRWDVNLIERVFYRLMRHTPYAVSIVDMFIPVLTAMAAGDETLSALIKTRVARPDVLEAEVSRCVFKCKCTTTSRLMRGDSPPLPPNCLSCLSCLCRTGNLKAVRRFIEGRADDGNTFRHQIAFVNACRSGNLALVQYLETVFTGALPITQMLAWTHNVELFKYILDKNLPYNKTAVFDLIVEFRGDRVFTDLLGIERIPNSSMGVELGGDFITPNEVASSRRMATYLLNTYKITALCYNAALGTRNQAIIDAMIPSRIDAGMPGMKWVGLNLGDRLVGGVAW